MRLVTGSTAALLLLTAACSAPQGSGASASMEAAPAAAPPTDAATPQQAVEGEAAQRTRAPGERPAPVGVLPMLAYSYTHTLEAPNARVTPLMRSHEQVCVQAGPSVCQVYGATLNVDRESGAVRGELNMRARPDWLASFRARLEGDARRSGGRSLGAGTSTEDLTRAIVDTEARLRAQTALRDRLQTLLETRSGTLADALAIETELARVQGEIDSVQSELAVMRTRVATSALTVTYVSETAAVGEGTWEPLSDAGSGFVRTLVGATAILVTTVAALLPFALVLGFFVWLGRRLGWFRRRPRATIIAPPEKVAPTA